MKQVFLENASSPDLKRLSDGTLLAIFDYRSDADAKETWIGSTVSKDEGRSWSTVKRIKITGRGGSPVHARHAKIFPLSEDRVRLYFTIDAPHSVRKNDDKAAASCTIRSAIARIGGRYRLEPDMALRFHDLPDASAAVVEFKDRTHLYVSPSVQTQVKKDSDDSVRHAIARDGRRFARVASILAKGVHSIGSIIPLEDRLRAYVSSEKGIQSMVSDDGTKWEMEPGVRLRRASDPAVTRLKDGSFLMLYTSSAERESANAAQSVAISESRDDTESHLQDSELTHGDIVALTEPDLADDVEIAAGEVDAFGFAPEPNFQEPVDYMQWYRQEMVGPPEEDNAYDAYVGFMTREDGEPGIPPDWPELNNMLNDLTYDGPPAPWNPDDRAEWEKSHQAVQKLLSQYRDASRRSGYTVRDLRKEPPNDPTQEDRLLFNLLLPTLAPHRQMCKAALSDAWRAENGKVDGEKMIDAFETVLRSAEHLSRGSTLIESLVATAERQLTESNARWALQHGVFNEKQLEKAFEILKRFNSGLEDPARFIRGEHAAVLDATQYLFGGRGPDGEIAADPERAEYLSQMVGDSETTEDDFIGLNADDARAAIGAFNDYFREVEVQMRMGYPEVRAADLEATHERYANASPMTRMAMPAWSRYHHLRGRAEASRRATQLIYATHLYRARNGQWPKSLDDLPDDVDRTIRTDPFSGRDFGYRLTADGPIIYSASENGIDDGGVHSPRWADGENRREEDSDDFVFWPPQP